MLDNATGIGIASLMVLNASMLPCAVIASE